MKPRDMTPAEARGYARALWGPRGEALREETPPRRGRPRSTRYLVGRWISRNDPTRLSDRVLEVLGSSPAGFTQAFLQVEGHDQDFRRVAVRNARAKENQ